MASLDSRGRCRATLVSPRHQSLQSEHRRSITPPPAYPQNEVRGHVLVEPTPSLNPDHELWLHTRRLITTTTHHQFTGYLLLSINLSESWPSRVSCRVKSHSVNIAKLIQDLAAFRNSSDVFGNPIKPTRVISNSSVALPTSLSHVVSQCPTTYLPHLPNQVLPFASHIALAVYLRQKGNFGKPQPPHKNF
jgi:hypothetical protein